MAKLKSAFFCQNCGAQSPKWVGKCAICGEWNSYVEEVVGTKGLASDQWRDKESTRPGRAVKLSEIKQGRLLRHTSRDQELNRVLGGGIVPGSMVLIGGEPGIGKSTLLLQLAMSQQEIKVLYISGEESPQQIKLRADRIAVKSQDCFLLAETSLEEIFTQINQLQPGLLIIDSIQTLHTSKIDASAGSVGQVRACTAELLHFAKETSTPVFLIGHITKEGSLAGPKVLEHMVDTVLQFEGDRHLAYRILRTTKNRFGPTSELGIYEMQSEGMREVSNPSEILISQKETQISGVSIGASIEGNRPLLIETQALVSLTAYGTPQRSSTGYDVKRLNMLLAVLEKRGGVTLGTRDIFLNIAGGLKVDDPALDLAICAAIVSSYEDQPIDHELCFVGEVGLGCEIRAVNRIESRISEAEKLGFKEIHLSSYHLKSVDKSKYKIKIVGSGTISELFEKLAT